MCNDDKHQDYQSPTKDNIDDPPLQSDTAFGYQKDKCRSIVWSIHFSFEDDNQVYRLIQ
jgi:hypothetical protein